MGTDHIEEKKRWEKFYQKYFSLEIDCTDTTIPVRPSDGTWNLLVIAQGLTLNQVYKSMSNTYKCWKFENDLDARGTKNARDTKSTYAIWVRDWRDCDVRSQDYSTGITLLENMLHELAYFDETGKHLGNNSIPFCSDSRSSIGLVPRVFWHAGGQEIRLGWYLHSSSVKEFST